jgi:hypothetical protein
VKITADSKLILWEEIATNILSIAKGGAQSEPNSKEFYAQEILPRIRQLRKLIKTEDAWHAANLAMETQQIADWAYFTANWESDTIRGRRRKEILKSATDAARLAKKLKVHERDKKWERKNQDLKARHPEWSKFSRAVEIAKGCKESHHTIRKRIT